MGNNSHRSNAPLTHKRPSDKPQATGSTPSERNKAAHDEHNQATVEELGREGLGVAAKE